MRANSIIYLANVTRQLTIVKVTALDEAIFDLQPAPFPNTIRWNVGHMVAVMDSIVFQRSGSDSKIERAFFEMFKGGTRPSNWDLTPPSKNELLDLLKKQMDDLSESFASRLDDRLPAAFETPAFKLETVGDLVGFALYHEGLHSSVISDLAKVIQYERK